MNLRIWIIGLFLGIPLRDLYLTQLFLGENFSNATRLPPVTPAKGRYGQYSRGLTWNQDVFLRHDTHFFSSSKISANHGSQSSIDKASQKIKISKIKVALEYAMVGLNTYIGKTQKAIGPHLIWSRLTQHLQFSWNCME